MSILSILDIGKTALNAQRLALEVTSENITNVNTAGYSRQTTVLETAPVSLERGFPLGSGVNVAEVRRAYDDFLQRQLKSENSTFGKNQTQLSSMTRVEQLFNDLSADGLGISLQKFFKSWQDLTANPQGQPERQAVLSQAQQVVEDFHRLNNYLSDVKRDANQTLEGLTSDINDKLTQVASLNDQIKQIELSSGSANELRDRRDLLIRELAQKIGVNYLEQTDGTINVSLVSGQPLVDGNKAAVFSLVPNPLNGSFYDIHATSPGGSTAVNITSVVGGANNSLGEMGGVLHVRDTLVNGFLNDLDELAFTLSNEVNTLHSTGFGLNGSTGLDFFSSAAFPAGYSGPGGISLGIASANDIAAADADPALGGTGNNKNGKNIASLYDKLLPMSAGTMTLSGFYNSLVGKVGVAVQEAKRGADLSAGILKQLENQRESNSGVSLDEELANLIKYQKAFEGAAKVINTGAEMMDTVLGLVR
ncbi:flagellar hook-associated protein FlgK [Geobacter sp. DSM 9736]|uniref:flagellar hook-associated protein FlgK n=1 Tax=Geobacter sp. DSM 9736 TaxID=1277350 RepID=UPI000B512156|nr:flagellar hook-associated protein FlgK [Geobacter sp. DSM 9736]SNB47033.1 flagellar hook-associated protein 1 FlgK [Geobacter sp. DSM 9736]